MKITTLPLVLEVAQVCASKNLTLRCASMTARAFFGSIEVNT